MSILLVTLHEVYQVEVVFLRCWRMLGLPVDVDAAEERTAFEDSNLYFLEDLSDVFLCDKIKGQGFVGMIPGVGDSICIKLKVTDLAVGSILIEFFIEIVNYCPIVYLFNLNVGIEESVSLGLLTSRVFIVFFYLLAIDDVFEPKDDSLLVFLFLFRERPPGQMAQSGRDTVAEGHVDQTDELVPVLLDVKVKEFDQEAMRGKYAGANSNFRGILLIVFELPLLLHHPNFNHFLDLGRLLKF